MKVPAKFKDRVYSLSISEGDHSEDSQLDAYELILKSGWSYDHQSYFICDTKQEILDIMKNCSKD